MIRAGIVGATGYAGAELARLLTQHPKVELAALSSVTFAGKPLSEIYEAYYRLCDLPCGTQERVVEQSDVVFAAVPSGLSQDLAAGCVSKGKAFVDLGADFRLKDEADYKKWYGGAFTHKELHAQAVYGLPELFRAQYAGKRIVANPGCFPTAVALALAPVLKSGLVEPIGIVADCKTGVTGAGRTPTQSTHFAELNESVSAYKVANHRHNPEMEQTLRLISGEDAAVTFVPHLLPVSRGILATCYARLKPGAATEAVRAAYEAQYAGEFFIRLLPEGRIADIKNVRLSNFCDISLHFDPHNSMLIAVSAIDNMVKGAAGQAVQSMNLLFGLDEKTGLTALPPAF